MSNDNIFHPHVNDILCARGKLAINWHRSLLCNGLIKHNRRECHSGDNSAKKELAANLVNHTHSCSPPGRFLKLIDNEWIELEHTLAIREKGRH